MAVGATAGAVVDIFEKVTFPSLGRIRRQFSPAGQTAAHDHEKSLYTRPVVSDRLTTSCVKKPRRDHRLGRLSYTLWAP